MSDERPETFRPKPTIIRNGLSTVGDLCEQYQITALEEFLESCRTFAAESTLSIAILGRFKAGKSSFLNHLLARELLPVGVIPVTAVVTEIQYAPRERILVQFLDGASEEVAIGRISEFVSEANNPENVKRVRSVRIESPSLEFCTGIRLVDTPGLESVLAHNTNASMEWLPNVGLALVAVAADAPLSQRDIELLQNLRQYTPSVSLLLTKVDLLTETECNQVRKFVEMQLAFHLDGGIPVFPYSVRPGFEDLQARLQETLLARVKMEASEQRAEILRHKLGSLLRECADYLTVALRAAETSDSEREELHQTIHGGKASLDDARLALRLIVRNAAGSTRASFEELLRADEQPVRARLLKGLERDFASWAINLRVVSERFDDWLRAAITQEMAQISRKRQDEFLEPLHRVSRQLAQSLQDFRNRLSARALEALGVPLRTTGTELRIRQPLAPDVRVGKIFDRNWELLSFATPISLVKGIVRRHFKRKVGDIVFMNLSRLASQWEEVVNASMLELEKESIRQLEALTSTIERLVTAAGHEAPRIREDLNRLNEVVAAVQE